MVVGAAVGVLIGRLAQLAQEQALSRRIEAALRRVATLVAGAAPPDELFAAVAEEAGQLLGADFAHMAHYESDDSVTFVGAWSRTGDHFPVGSQWSLAGENISTAVFRQAIRPGSTALPMPPGRLLPHPGKCASAQRPGRRSLSTAASGA